MNKRQIVDRLRTLVKAEWDSLDEGGFPVTKDTDTDLCGVLFFKNFAYASNGHFIVRIDNPSGIKAEGKPIFYSYNEDKVLDGNPFLRIGLAPKNLKKLFLPWLPNVVKVRKELLIDTIRKHYPQILERRKIIAEIKFRKGGPFISLNYYNREACELDFPEKACDLPMSKVKVWKSHISKDVTIYVDLNYLYKSLECFEEYHIVDMVFKDPLTPLVLKGQNKRQNKPIMNIVIALTFNK